MVKMNEDKASMYIVAIVGVVAAVGILVLLMGAGLEMSNNFTGQAVSAKGSTGGSTDKDTTNKDKEDPKESPENANKRKSQLDSGCEGGCKVVETDCPDGAIC